MTLWRLHIRLAGPTLSAWQADTIWGHLCWAMRHTEGEDALLRWLERYRGGGPPPLLVSDGFPGDALPIPLLPQPPQPPGAPDDPDRASRLKQLRRNPWLSRDEFVATLSEGELTLSLDDARRKELGWQEAPTWRNTISRLTGCSLQGAEDEPAMPAAAAPEEALGGLFSLRERWPRADHITAYVRLADPAEQRRYQDLFATLCYSGFGKRRSIGYGAVTEITWAPETELGERSAATNGFVTLSSFVPRATDPTRGVWDLRTKHGRFSDEIEGPPWKVPLLLLTTGSSFLAPELRDWYGGLVSNIAVTGGTPARGNAVQYAYAFPIPAHLEGLTETES